MSSGIDKKTEDRKYWLGLKMSPPLRNRLYVLAEKAGGPKRLWEASRSELRKLGLTEPLAAEAVIFRRDFDVDLAFKKLIGQGVSIVTDEDDCYPYILRLTPGHPSAIFVRGQFKESGVAVAIVGSRKATAYGKAFAYELAADLAAAGVVIVSGAARGIDTAAHKGALEAGGITYAVLGCGLDVIYPPENVKLYKEIEIKGALVSEYPLGTAPISHHFPARNRIVAGMCNVVIVVEAGERSGALITADFALEYGREVMAMPGYSKSEVSRGANLLIKQGAYLVESADDVLEILGIEKQSHRAVIYLDNIQRNLIDAIGWEPKRIDEIARIANESIAATCAVLLSLELEGLIKKDLSGNYIRTR